MDGAVQTLLGSVGQLLREEYKQLRRVGGEVAELRDDVATMKALLLMHSEADEGAVDHFIREWMKQLRELAFDAEDCVDDYRLRIKSRPSDGAGAWLRRLFGTLSPRRRLAGEIVLLRARAAAIRERHVPYGVDRKALRRSVWASAASSGSARDLFRAIDPHNHRFKDFIGNQAEDRASPIELVHLLNQELHSEDEGAGAQLNESQILLEDINHQSKDMIGDQAQLHESQIDHDDMIRLWEARECAAARGQFATEADINHQFEDIKDIIGDQAQLHESQKEDLDEDMHVLWAAADRAAAEGEGTIGADPAEEIPLHFFVGPSGVGKTTLAIEVCRRLKAHYDYQAMVALSPAFGSNSSLRFIRSRPMEWLFHRPLHWRGGEEAVTSWHLEQFVEGLTDKRYLIVIDDVRSVLAFDAVLSAIPVNNNGSRIIITTQSMVLANKCRATRGGVNISIVSHLDKEDSKRMFLSRAFCSMDDFHSKKPEGSPLEGKEKVEEWFLKGKEKPEGSSLKGKEKLDGSPPRGKEIRTGMEQVIEICDGLPLAIACIAGVLAGYIAQQRPDKFEKACESISSLMDTIHPLERIRHIITLNYNNLPNEVKGCMMYLSIFPRSYVIDKDRLLCRWIAEGLVAQNQEMSMQEVAECYFEELLCRNMIEPVIIGYDGRIKSCKVHDMVLEVVVSKALETYFVAILGGQHKGMSKDRIRRLSIHGDGDSWPCAVDPQQTSGSSIECMNLHRIRSLSIFQLQGHKLLDQLGKFVLLRVLDLENCKGVTIKHVRYACQLHLLKFLNLRGTDIDKVPPEIEKLEHLQTFDLRDTLLDYQLPQVVTNLEKLERLLISKRHERDYMWRLPRGLQKMKALHEVRLAVLRNDVQVAKEVGELQQLEDLYINVDVPKQSKEVLDAFADSLCKLHSLRCLSIGVSGSGNGEQTLDFLHRLPHAAPQMLRRLGIHGGINDLPTWIGLLTDLVEFVITDACLNGDQLFDVLCSLPNLKSIWMQHTKYSDNELVARSHHQFPSLINFIVTSDAEENPRVIQFEERSMPNLETLEVRFADKSIVGTQYLPSLKEVKLTGEKDKPALSLALEQLKGENEKRPPGYRSSQFHVVVSYE